MKLAELLIEKQNINKVDKLKAELSSLEQELSAARKSNEDKEVINSIKQEIGEIKELIRKEIASSLPKDEKSVDDNDENLKENDEALYKVSKQGKFEKTPTGGRRKFSYIDTKQIKEADDVVLTNAATEVLNGNKINDVAKKYDLNMEELKGEVNLMKDHIKTGQYEKIYGKKPPKVK